MSIVEDELTVARIIGKHKILPPKFMLWRDKLIIARASNLSLAAPAYPEGDGKQARFTLDVVRSLREQASFSAWLGLRERNQTLTDAVTMVRKPRSLSLMDEVNLVFWDSYIKLLDPDSEVCV